MYDVLYLEVHFVGVLCLGVLYLEVHLAGVLCLENHLVGVLYIS